MSGVTILNVKDAFLPTIYEHQNIIMPILIILAVLFACIFACAHPIRYDVVLDNSVSYNEFIEKYDVIAVNGKIYTVKLKDQ